MNNHNICCKGCYVLGKQKAKKEIIEKVENLIDHYEPYRPITDSSEMKEIRKVLRELISNKI